MRSRAGERGSRRRARPTGRAPAGLSDARKDVDGRPSTFYLSLLLYRRTATFLSVLLLPPPHKGKSFIADAKHKQTLVQSFRTRRLVLASLYCVADGGRSSLYRLCRTNTTPSAVIVVVSDEDDDDHDDATATNRPPAQPDRRSTQFGSGGAAA